MVEEEGEETMPTLECIVEEDQLSLAIGKRGQNVRLASALVGAKIDIKSEQAVKEQVAQALQRMLLSRLQSGPAAHRAGRAGRRGRQGPRDGRRRHGGRPPGGRRGRRRRQLGQLGAAGLTEEDREEIVG
jgi:hypothetical protein